MTTKCCLPTQFGSNQICCSLRPHTMIRARKTIQLRLTARPSSSRLFLAITCDQYFTRSTVHVSSSCATCHDFRAMYTLLLRRIMSCMRSVNPPIHCIYRESCSLACYLHSSRHIWQTLTSWCASCAFKHFQMQPIKH